eukprot:PhF_6_TR37279/c0_g1_i2/m.54949
MQALPPRHIYSALIHNQTTAPIHVKASYEVPPENKIQIFETIIAPGFNGEVPQRIVPAGTMTMTAHVSALFISLVGAASPPKTVSGQAPFKVVSPVKMYNFIVKESDAALTLEEPDAVA